jgi:Asp-tRNA(Asn)/Glu-tRNA(Gln) amidotransferase A subunit family amidase
MSDLINSSLRELSAALAAKKVSAVELATLFLDRIDRNSILRSMPSSHWTATRP